MNVRHLTFDDANNTEQMQSILDNQMDVTGANHVEISTDKRGTVMWVNVNGLCLLRICRIRHMRIEGVEVR